MLEGLGTVAQTERHEEVLEQTERRDDRRFRDVLDGHRYLMVGEELAAVQLVEEVEDAG